MERTTRDLEVEPTQVIEDTCSCCGCSRTVVSGFVHARGGNALAAYSGSLYPSGPQHDEEAWIDVILGTWGRDDVSDHVTFGAWCKVGQGCRLVDGAQASSEEEPLFGQRLTREEGLLHPRVGEFWKVIDAVLTADPTVSRFYYRSPECPYRST